jgi:CelD/BcsL family acetyltransferase involved in cellulose biosynthesis
MYFILAVREVAPSDPFIGLALHAHSIRWAIKHGFKTYDLRHGDEPCKYSLGAEDRWVKILAVRRRSRVKTPRLDPASPPLDSLA